MKIKWPIKEAIFIILFISVIFFLLTNLVDFNKITDMDYVKEKISSYGMVAPVIYIIIMAIAIIISPIPSLPLDVVAGIIWGPLLATVYSVIGGLIGAMISFYIARSLGRIVIEKILHKHISFCDNCNESTITWIILISRLFPFFQFDIISYGAGLTNVKPGHFALATFIGMIPMTYLFARFGQIFMVGNIISIALSITLIISIFLVPILIKKYNLFGLKNKIKIN